MTSEVGVRLYGAELLALVLLPFVGWKEALARHRALRVILGAYGLWVFAIILSDIINQTPVFDSARNAATPLLGGAILLFVVSVLQKNTMALLTFLAVSVIIKGLMGESFYGDAFDEMSFSWQSVQADTNYFKVRIEPFVTPAILLLACLAARWNFLAASGVLLAGSVAYLGLDSRSSGLALFLAALAILAVHFKYRPRLGPTIVGSLVFGLIAYGGYVAYVNYTMEHNPFGHNGKQLAAVENPYNPVELLMQGRSEWGVMGKAISERPVTGWGSWAEDEDHRFALLRINQMELYDYGAIDRRDSFGYIPAHSTVGTAWLWSGILGLIALAWFAICVVRVGMTALTSGSILLPAVVYFAIMMAWHYFFSPPQHVRLTFPMALAGLLVLASAPQVSRRVSAFRKVTRLPAVSRRLQTP